MPELSEEPGSLEGVDTSAPAIALVGGNLHPVTSPDVEGGTLVIQDGRIVAMGANADVPAGAERIDVSGLDLWPGLISLNSGTGLHEIGSVRMTDDTSERGGNQPDLRVSASINADSAHINVTRHNGITRAQSAPAGGGPIMGQSAIVRLTGLTWEEMLTVDRDMLHVRFPSTSNRAKKKDEESEATKELRAILEEAREYARRVDEAQRDGVAAPTYDPRLAALAPYARGEKRVAMHVGNAQTILFAVKFAQEQELDVVLYGASEAWKVAGVLAREQVPVVVGPVWQVPFSSYDPYDAGFANAAVLQRAGVPFGDHDRRQRERTQPRLPRGDRGRVRPAARGGAARDHLLSRAHPRRGGSARQPRGRQDRGRRRDARRPARDHLAGRAPLHRRPRGRPAGRPAHPLLRALPQAPARAAGAVINAL